MKKLPKSLYILLILLLFSTFCYSGWKLFSYYRESARTQSDYDALSQLKQETPTLPAIVKPTTPPEITGPTATAPTEPPETEPDPNEGLTPMTHPVTGETVWMRQEFCALFELNPDIIGWITLDGTHIDYPVVHRPQDRNYYLHRDFYGKKSSRGCIYAREECDFLTPSDNIVLYGHMMNDYTMFGDLSYYVKEKYWKKHPSIRFDTLRETGLYEVICVFKTSANADEGFPYHQYTTFSTEAELQEFWTNCTATAYYDTGLTPQLGDKLLTLSTCEYTLEHGRLVVIARKTGD